MGCEGRKKAFQPQRAAWLSGRKEHNLLENLDFSPQLSCRGGKRGSPPPQASGLDCQRREA